MIPAATQTDLVEAYRAQLEGRLVLLYDGVCVLCNRTVQFLLRHERDPTIRFVPLESPLGQALLSLYDAHACSELGPDSSREGVILISDTLTPAAQLNRRTDAFAIILPLLNGPWPIIAQLLRWTPRFLREAGYTLVARYRYRLWGRHDVCPIPTLEQRARILGI